MLYAGIDVGGTSIKSGLVDQTGRIVARHRTGTPSTDLNAFLSCLIDAVDVLRQSAANGIDAVGIGVPGLRSSATHAIEVSPNIACLQGVNLEAVLSKQVHLEVFSENDANAAALGEFAYGAARGTRNSATLTVGTGLGCGLILNQQLFSGSSGYAGEFGHVAIQPNGRRCGCGKTGCLETLVSAGAVVRAFRERDPGAAGRVDISSEDVWREAAQGNANAVEALAETGHWLGIGCALLIQTLNPDAIVLAGNVMRAGNFILEPAARTARDHSFRYSFEACRIVPAMLGSDAGIVGAAALAQMRQTHGS